MTVTAVTAVTAARRIANLRACMAELELDGMLISHLPNVRYLTGFSGSNGWLLLSANEQVFVTDGRYKRSAAEELDAGGGFEVIVAHDGVLQEVAQRAARTFGRASGGFESEYLTVADWERLREHDAPMEWVPTADLVGELRSVKDAHEIASIEKAASIAATALRETLALVVPGMTEADLASDLDHRMRKLGAERPAFETIVASGPRSALPHAGTSGRKIQEGELLLCDLGASWQGYCSDLTRTFVVGEPDERQSEVYRAVLEAHHAARDALQEGAETGSVDAAARELLESKKLGGEFPHSTGHGLGLEVHEPPRLRAGGVDALRANMVVTVEPGLYFAGWGGVRIEDDFLVTGGGPRRLVQLEKDRLQSVPL